jgi:predicted transcriptional regulator YdeE
METYNLKNDLEVFGEQVKTFPNGVGEAFEHLIKMFPANDKRTYYGIATMDKNGNMAYYAAAEEIYKGEAEKYKCERYTIEKGEYLAETLEGWQDKIHCIKDVFTKLIQDEHADKMKPGVEWYKNDKEMMCMVKTIQSKK